MLEVSSYIFGNIYFVQTCGYYEMTLELGVLD